MNPSILTYLAFGALSLTLTSLAQAGPVSSPAPGSVDRKEILDAIRPRAESQLGRPVEFVVTEMKMQDGWAFAILTAQRPGGKSIPISETIFSPGELDTFTIFALLEDSSSGWNLMEYDLDPKEPTPMVWREKYGLPSTLL